MFVLFFMVMAVLVMMNVLIILMMVMMFFVMSMFTLVMMVVVFVRMRVSVCHITSVCVLVAVLMRKVNVEFDSLDGGFMSAGNVQMVTVKIQFLQFVLQVVRVNAQVEQRANEHVAADPAEYVQIQGFHLCSAVVTAPRGFGNLTLHYFTPVAQVD